MIDDAQALLPVTRFSEVAQRATRAPTLLIATDLGELVERSDREATQRLIDGFEHVLVLPGEESRATEELLAARAGTRGVPRALIAPSRKDAALLTQGRPPALVQRPASGTPRRGLPSPLQAWRRYRAWRKRTAVRRVKRGWNAFRILLGLAVLLLILRVAAPGLFTSGPGQRPHGATNRAILGGVHSAFVRCTRTHSAHPPQCPQRAQGQSGPVSWALLGDPTSRARVHYLGSSRFRVTGRYDMKASSSGGRTAAAGKYRAAVVWRRGHAKVTALRRG